MKFTTRCIHGASKKYDTTGAVSVPIFQTATFTHYGVEKSTGFDYTRCENPTREHLEHSIANLEEGDSAMAFSSGMAAVAAFMELFSQSDHIIASDDLYGGTIRLFENISKKNGIKVTQLDTTDISAIKQAIRPETKAIFVETPTNPMMQVTDIAAVSELINSQKVSKEKIIFAVDNTFLTPFFQRPLALGADIVIHSGTKYLCGHNDTLAGFLVVKNANLSEKLRFIYKTIGAALSPFDSWLMIRGIKTLAVRLKRQEETARKIADWMQNCDNIKAVHYCGLPTHAGYEISRRQSDGFGGMISFEVEDAQTAKRILEKIKLISFAESLGGVESLMTYPYLQTHADVPEKHRIAKGINEKLLRLSVGLEDAGDLIADIVFALGE
ncbi:MAG: PLP-dependent aspartate aminotransferase family protein [Defluviitaleaceae bacterium]|nr:PLP-dependent aspartate aminotransferase family protein [Defluviitaleaceae bacterium]